MGHGLHDSLVDVQGRLDQGLPVTGHARAHDAHMVGHVKVDAPQDLDGSRHRVALVARVVLPADVPVGVQDDGLDGRRPGVDAQEAVGPGDAGAVAEGVGVVAGGLLDFVTDELVFEIVLVILVFAIGQLAVDQVAQCVVGVFDAVVFFEAVAATNVAALPFGRFVGKDVVGGVEGEGFAAASLAVSGFLNLSDFIVNVIKDAASVIGALDQVSGFVIGVAAVEHVTTKVV